MLSQHSLSRLRLLVDGINGSLVRKRKTVYCPPARNETIAQMECSLSAMKKIFFPGHLKLSTTNNFQEWADRGSSNKQ